MKFLDYVLDLFWVVTAIWMVLYFWVWSPVWSPLFIKDILYGITDCLDYWMFLNAVIGTIRFIVIFRRDLKDEL